MHTVKAVLRNVLWKCSLWLQELETVLSEVKAVVNFSPLAYVYAGAREPSPISPAHFWIGRSPTVLPEPSTLAAVTSSSSTCDDTLPRLHYRHKSVGGFSNRWKKEYPLCS